MSHCSLSFSQIQSNLAFDSYNIEAHYESATIDVSIVTYTAPRSSSTPLFKLTLTSCIKFYGAFYLIFDTDITPRYPIAMLLFLIMIPIFILHIRIWYLILKSSFPIPRRSCFIFISHGIINPVACIGLSARECQV